MIKRLVQTTEGFREGVIDIGKRRLVMLGQVLRSLAQSG